MALYVRWNDKWNLIGGASGGSAVFKVGPRGNGANGFVDNITHENLSNIDFNIPIEGSTKYLFANNNNLEKVPDYYNFKRSTNSERMFYSASSLLEFNNFDMNFATNTSEMFYACSELIEVVGLELGRSTTLYRMFYNARKLKRVKLMNLSEVNRVDQMFTNCTSLESVRMYGLGSRNQSNLTYRTLDVSRTNMNSGELVELAYSLGVSNASTAWRLSYNGSLNFDTTILTDKGWIANPI